jgi:hypothetical protein
MPRQAPPPDYYAENLDFLLDQVQLRNDDLLAQDERALIAAWRRADVPGRRLFARLLTRKGPWFRVDRLRYAEVPDVPAAVASLCELGLVARNPPAPADALLGLFTRAELARLFPRVRAPGKSDWIEACVARYPDAAIRARLAALHPWIAVAPNRAFGTCGLLFFGSDRQDLTDFVLQDLGVLRFEAYEVGARTRPFRSRAEVDEYLLCRRLAGLLAADEHDPQAAQAIRDRLRQPATSRTVARLRDRLLNRLGLLHERRGEFDEALESYGLSRSHPARERRARLLRRLGDEAGFAALVEGARVAPWSAEEEDFAHRAAAGLGCAGKAGRRNARDPRVQEVPLDRAALEVAGSGSIERHALALLAAAGCRGWHLENSLPLGLAGLVYWDEVFAPVEGAFSHPMQMGPRDLFWPDFARVRAAAIETRTAGLRDPHALRAHLRRTAREKQGVANRLVHWGAWTPELVDALADVATPGLLLDMARRVIGDLERARSGFPDLTVIRPDGGIEFVEVKGPTDQLQAAQRTWLRTLDSLGLTARVLKFKA